MPGSTGTGRWADRPSPRATSVFPEEYGSPTAPLPPPPPPLPPPPLDSLPDEEDLEPEPEPAPVSATEAPAPTLPEEIPTQPPESPAKPKYSPADARAAVSALGRRLRPRRSEEDGAESPEGDADGLADGEPAGDGAAADGVAGPAAAVSALARRLLTKRSEEDGAESPEGDADGLADGEPAGDGAAADGVAGPAAAVSALARRLLTKRSEEDGAESPEGDADGLPDHAPAALAAPSASDHGVSGNGDLAVAGTAAAFGAATVELPTEAPPSGPETTGRRWRDTPIVEHEATASPGDDTVYETLPTKGNRRQRVRITRGVHSRRLIRRIDVWTVFKVSLVFYVLLLLIVLVAGVAVWNVAQAFGLIHNIEKSIRSLFDLTSFHLHPLPVLAYTALGGAVLTIVGTLLNVVMALLYNLISDIVGGAQVVVVTEPE